jgi:hypothetical protein
MSEHAGELGFVVQKRQNPASEVDVAARESERVDRRLVNDSEVPRQMWTFRSPREAEADILDIRL